MIILAERRNAWWLLNLPQTGTPFRGCLWRAGRELSVKPISVCQTRRGRTARLQRLPQSPQSKIPALSSVLPGRVEAGRLASRKAGNRKARKGLEEDHFHSWPALPGMDLTLHLPPKYLPFAGKQGQAQGSGSVELSDLCTFDI